MTKINDVSTDESTSTTFTLEISVQNGRLTPTQRQAVSDIIQRVCTGLGVQLELTVPDRFDIELEHWSSTFGTQSLDIA